LRQANQAFESNGFFVIAGLPDDDDFERLAANVAEIEEVGAGSRTLLDQPWCQSLARQLKDRSTCWVVSMPEVEVLEVAYNITSRQ
jgi:hypothetical protein